MNAVKYKTALTTTGVIRESLSKIRLWEFSTRHWYQEICCLYKMLLESPCYFHKSVPLPSRLYRTRQCRKILLFNVKNNFFRKTFSASPIIEWNKSNTDITNDASTLMIVLKCSVKKKFQDISQSSQQNIWYRSTLSMLPKKVLPAVAFSEFWKNLWIL